MQARVVETGEYNNTWVPAQPGNLGQGNEPRLVAGEGFPGLREGKAGPLSPGFQPGEANDRRRRG